MDSAKGRGSFPKPVGKGLSERSLPRIIERIRRDARDHTERFLEECEVRPERE
jgi:hypothetical protein